MDNYMIGLLILLASVFISRSMNEKAMQKLDTSQKAALIDLFSKDRLSTFGMLIGIIVLFFLSIKFHWLEPMYSYFIYTICIFIFIIITGYSSYKKLKQNEFPDTYIRSYIISAALRFVGLMIFFVFMDKYGLQKN